MLANRLTQTKRLVNPISYAFSRTFAIISGGPQNDAETVKIINGLKSTYGGDINFVGVGPESLRPHFKKLYANTSVLDPSPFLVHRSYKQQVQDAFVTLNRKLIKQLTASGYFDDLLHYKISAVINVGNFSLTKRLNTAMIEKYKQQLTFSPPTFLYGRMHSLRQVTNEAFLDFQFSCIPRKSNSWTQYEFPHLLIGYDGLYNALKYLNQFGPIPTQAEGFGEHMFKLTTAARKKFRAQHKISEDTFLIVIAPGNSNQAQFVLKQITPALEKFRADPEIKSFGLDNFKILVLNHPEHANSKDTLPKYVTVVNAEDRFGAMCAADYGLIHDGQQAVQAAACQLPATTLNNVSFMWAYLSNMLNLYQSPLNVATDSLGYTELKSTSEAIPEKIYTLLVEHFRRPKLKFFYIERYEETLAELTQTVAKDGHLKKSGLEQSFDVIKSFADKYEALDVKSYSGHWQARKRAIIPEKAA